MEELRERVRQLADAAYLPEAVKEMLKVLYKRDLKLLISEECDPKKSLEDVVAISEYMARYCSLIGLAVIFNKEKRELENKQKNYIKNYFNKNNLTMGNMVEMLNQPFLKPSEAEFPQLRHLIEGWENFFNQTKIVEIRNDDIGHPEAMVEKWSEETIKQIVSIVEVMCDALEITCDCALEVVYENETLWLRSNLKDRAKNNVFIDLFPWMVCENNKDVFLWRGQWKNPEYATFYPTSPEKTQKTLKVTEKIQQEIFMIRSKCLVHEYENFVLEGNMFQKVEDMLREKHRNQKYFQNNTIEDWYTECLKKKKGLFLLRMNRGLGKTAFVASKDPKIENKKNNKIKNDKEAIDLVCCYYCNKQQYNGVDDFISFCNNDIYDDNEIRLTQRPSMEEPHGNHGGEKNLAMFLKDVKEALRETKYQRIILFIDGVDEIVSSLSSKNNSKKTIWDYIPTNEELVEGTYIFLTCRANIGEPDINAYPTEFIENKLEIVPRENQLLTNMQDEGHRGAVYEFIKQYFGESDLNKVEAVAKEMQYNFVDLKLYAKFLKYTDLQYVRSFGSYEKTLEQYLKFLENCYGKIARRIAANIVYAKRGLYIGELVDLSKEGYQGKITLEELDIIDDLEPIIFYGRTKQGTVFSLNNLKYETTLKELLRKDLNEMLDIWIQKILEDHKVGLLQNDSDFYRNEFYKENPSEPPQYAQTYLHAYIYDYAKELGKVDQLATKPFIKCLGNFELHRKSDNFGTLGVLQDIQVLNAAIEIYNEYFKETKEFSYEECRDVWTWYNDMAYLYTKIKEDGEVKRNQELATQQFEKLKEKVKTEAQKIDYMSRQGKFYNNCGSFEYQSASVNWDKALECFKKSFDLRFKMIKKYEDLTFQEEAEGCLLSCKNVLSVYARKNELTETEKKDAEKYYRKGRKLLKDIVTFVDQFSDKEQEKRRFNLNTYRDGRVEYGYRFLDSELDRFYALYLRHKDYDDASKSMEVSIAKMKALLEERPYDASILRGIIQRYLEVSKLYQEKERIYLRDATNTLKMWEEQKNQEKLVEDSRFAEIYYRRWLIEKLTPELYGVIEEEKEQLAENAKTKEDELSQLKEETLKHIQYLDEPGKKEKAPESALFMYELIHADLKQ